MTNRREFFVQLSMGSAALAGFAMSKGALAQGAMVAESDAQPSAVGYKTDGSRADKVKFPRYAAGQQCSTCALYQGKYGDVSGPCPLFAGKQVQARGWCSVWSKKA